MARRGKIEEVLESCLHFSEELWAPSRKLWQDIGLAHGSAYLKVHGKRLGQKSNIETVSVAFDNMAPFFLEEDAMAARLFFEKPRDAITTEALRERLRAKSLTFLSYVGRLGGTEIVEDWFEANVKEQYSLPPLFVVNALLVKGTEGKFSLAVRLVEARFNAWVARRSAHLILETARQHERTSPLTIGYESGGDLEKLLDLVSSRWPGFNVVVWVYNKEYSALISELSTVSGFQLDIGKEEDFPWLVFESGEELDIPNIETFDVDGRHQTPNANVYLKSGFRSAYLYPIFVHGQCRGVLGFFLEDRGSFPSELKSFQLAILREVTRSISEFDLLKERVAIADRLKALSPLLAIGRESSQRFHDIRDNLDAMRGVLIEIRDQETRIHTPRSGAKVSDLCERGLELSGKIKETLSKQLQTFKKAREKRQKVDLCAWLRLQDDKFRFLAGEAGVDYEASLPEEPIHFSIQTFYFERALENLISNGVYFSKQSTRAIKRTFVRLELIADEFEVRISVLDSGAGVKQNPVEMIFQEGETTRPGGFGVGLGIVKSIVEEHLGKIEVRNSDQWGALFTIVLPRRK